MKLELVDCVSVSHIMLQLENYERYHMIFLVNFWDRVGQIQTGYNYYYISFNLNDSSGDTSYRDRGMLHLFWRHLAYGYG